MKGEHLFHEYLKEKEKKQSNDKVGVISAWRMFPRPELVEEIIKMMTWAYKKGRQSIQKAKVNNKK